MTRAFCVVSVLNALLAANLLTAQAQEDVGDLQLCPTNRTEVLNAVFEFRRASDADVLIMRGGDRISGVFDEQNYTISTSYGVISLNSRVIAGIDFEGGTNNIGTVVTVNDNHFSGFISNTNVVVRLEDGHLMSVRREEILKGIFHVRSDECKSIPQRKLFVLRNGDCFSGVFKGEGLVVDTAYGPFSVNLNRATTVRLVSRDMPYVKVQMRNGDLLQGLLKTGDIGVDLDVGPSVCFYRDRLEAIYCRDGFRLDQPDRLLVGDKLRLKGTVTQPREGWGNVRLGDVGVVTAVDGDRLTIDFTRQSGWLGHVVEMEKVP